MGFAKKTLELGGREWIGLPELGIDRLKAMIDTGVGTSALHAVEFETYAQDDVEYISFRVPIAGPAGKIRRSAPLIDFREMNDTSGLPEGRPVVWTMLSVGHRCWHAEVSLSERQNLDFDLTVGRTALGAHRLMVRPDRSVLVQTPSVSGASAPAQGAHSRKTS